MAVVYNLYGSLCLGDDPGFCQQFQITIYNIITFVIWSGDIFTHIEFDLKEVMTSLLYK